MSYIKKFLSLVASKSCENKASWQIVVGKGLQIASDQQPFAGEGRTKDNLNQPVEMTGFVY
jgi:hypothetical protein